MQLQLCLYSGHQDSATIQTGGAIGAGGLAAPVRPHKRGARKVPMCRTELAARSGRLSHGHAGSTVVSPGGLSARIFRLDGRAAPLRQAHVESMARHPRVAANDRCIPAAASNAGTRAWNRARVGTPCTHRGIFTASGAHTPVVQTPSTNISLTALSCGRTFPDSAVMKAFNRRQRPSHTDPLARSEGRYSACLIAE